MVRGRTPGRGGNTESGEITEKEGELGGGTRGRGRGLTLLEVVSQGEGKR
jgi:hypothetical protein